MNRESIIIDINEEGDVSIEAGNDVVGPSCEKLLQAFSGLGKERKDKQRKKPQYWQRQNQVVQSNRSS